jgi:hypothetical protein
MPYVIKGLPSPSPQVPKLSIIGVLLVLLTAGILVEGAVYERYCPRGSGITFKPYRSGTRQRGEIWLAPSTDYPVWVPR